AARAAVLVVDLRVHAGGGAFGGSAGAGPARAVLAGRRAGAAGGVAGAAVLAVGPKVGASHAAIGERRAAHTAPLFARCARLAGQAASPAVGRVRQRIHAPAGG